MKRVRRVNIVFLGEEILPPLSRSSEKTGALTVGYQETKILNSEKEPFVLINGKDLVLIRYGEMG